MATNGKVVAPLLFPVDPEDFLAMLRLIVREELETFSNKQVPDGSKIQGLTYKPLYKMEEVCQIFDISTTTVYDWISKGKLKPKKIRSRVFFLWTDLQQLMKGDLRQLL